MKKPDNIHIPHAHDYFFRQSMSNNNVARSFFEFHLPDDLRQIIDLNKLELQPGSYIDDLRQESIADMLFRTKFTKEDGYLYLVVDHQSKPDELMPYRILKYVCNFIDQHLKDNRKKRIPLILPLVVYHGLKKWNYSTNLKDLVDAPNELVEKYFLKPFILIDLNKIEDTVLKQNMWSGVMEFALKHIFSRDILPHVHDIMETLKYLQENGGKPIVEMTLIYMLDRGEISNKEAFVDLVKKELSPEIGAKIMTGAEQFIADGIKIGFEKGLEQGIEQGLEQGREKSKIEIANRLLSEGVDFVFIQKITGLSLYKIKELKENFLINV